MAISGASSGDERALTLAERLRDDPLYRELGRLGRTRTPLNEATLLLCDTLLQCPEVLKRAGDGAGGPRRAQAARAAVVDAVAMLEGDKREVGEAVFGIGRFGGKSVTERKLLLTNVTTDMYADLRPRAIYDVMYALGYDPFASALGTPAADSVIPAPLKAENSTQDTLDGYPLFSLDTIMCQAVEVYVVGILCGYVAPIADPDRRENDYQLALQDFGDDRDVLHALRIAARYDLFKVYTQFIAMGDSLKWHRDRSGDVKVSGVGSTGLAGAYNAFWGPVSVGPYLGRPYARFESDRRALLLMAHKGSGCLWEDRPGGRSVSVGQHLYEPWEAWYRQEFPGSVDPFVSLFAYFAAYLIPHESVTRVLRDAEAVVHDRFSRGVVRYDDLVGPFGTTAKRELSKRLDSPEGPGPLFRYAEQIKRLRDMEKQ